jgi:hypothetical protein
MVTESRHRERRRDTEVDTADTEGDTGAGAAAGAEAEVGTAGDTVGGDRCQCGWLQPSCIRVPGVLGDSAAADAGAAAVAGAGCCMVGQRKVVR